MFNQLEDEPRRNGYKPVYRVVYNFFLIQDKCSPLKNVKFPLAKQLFARITVLV